MSYSKEDLRDLYDGRLPWHKTFEIMSKPKDDDRFNKYVRYFRSVSPTLRG
jgi:acetone carboxylase gamma subunit